MTIKEYNALRRSVYDKAMENDEIAEAVNMWGVATIWEITQGERHIVLVVSHDSRLNDNTLREHGIAEPENAFCKKVLRLNRQTKCADF